MNCNANIYFNQKCIQNNTIPEFAKINIPNNSPASKFTHTHTHTQKVTFRHDLHSFYSRVSSTRVLTYEEN